MVSKAQSTTNITVGEWSGRIVGTTAEFKPVNVESDQPVRISKKEQKKLDKLKKKQEKKGKKNTEVPSGISGPTNVVHVSSIGWNPNSGFQVFFI